MGFHFSINGCGLKTAENMEAAATIPLDRLLLETDAPWCSLNATHASNAHLKSLPKPFSDVFFPPSAKSYVPGKTIKGRNEPCAIGGVAWVMAKLKGLSLEEVSEAAWKNTLEVFGLEEGELEIVIPEEAVVTTSKEVPPLSSIDAFPPLGS